MCGACDYDLSGSPGGVCPECGAYRRGQAMKRRRGRPWVRWTLLGATVGVAMALALSLVRTTGVEVPGIGFGVGGGCLVIEHVDQQPTGWDFGPAMPLLAWWPGLMGTDPGWMFLLPLWIPLAATGLTTAGVWRRWWSWQPSTACRSCGYDRSGLAPSSVCPECGATAGAKP